MVADAQPRDHRRQGGEADHEQHQPVAAGSRCRYGNVGAAVEHLLELADRIHDRSLVIVILLVVHDALGEFAVGLPLPRIAPDPVAELPLHRMHGDRLSGHQRVGVVFSLLEFRKLGGREPLVLHQLPERNGAAIRPRLDAIPHVEDVPVGLLKGRIARDDIRSCHPREFVGTGTKFMGQAVRLVAIGLRSVERVLIGKREHRQGHQPEDRAERRQLESLERVHRHFLAPCIATPRWVSTRSRDGASLVRIWDACGWGRTAVITSTAGPPYGLTR